MCSLGRGCSRPCGNLQVIVAARDGRPWWFCFRCCRGSCCSSSGSSSSSSSSIVVVVVVASSSSSSSSSSTVVVVVVAVVLRSSSSSITALAALPRRSQAHKIAPPAPLAGCGAAGRMSLSGTSLRPTCQCRHMTAGLWANVLAGEGMLKALRESAGDCGCQGREAVVVLLPLLSW